MLHSSEKESEYTLKYGTMAGEKVHPTPPLCPD